jgi:hypothetical protein
MSKKTPVVTVPQQVTVFRFMYRIQHQVYTFDVCEKNQVLSAKRLARDLRAIADKVEADPQSCGAERLIR